ncbi:hypothetical protein LINPERHAP2_LOCUS32036 [Linum perenne]
MSHVFSLVSDKQFIRAMESGSNIFVFEYDDDPSSIEIIYACSSQWKQVATIGSDEPWKALEVFGVTIEADRLMNLFNDLTYTDASSTGQKRHLVVNRQGLCLVFVGGKQIKRLRINDNFGWSRYGVKPPTRTMWSVCDMSNGVVLSDRGEERSDCKKCCCCTRDGLKNVIEEKDKLMEEKDKFLMEKIELLKEEVASLKGALRALIK